MLILWKNRCKGYFVTVLIIYNYFHLVYIKTVKETFYYCLAKVFLFVCDIIMFEDSVRNLVRQTLMRVDIFYQRVNVNNGCSSNILKC